MAICSLRLRPVCSLRPSAPIALHELEFDEVMNILGGRMIAHLRLAGVRCEFGGNRIQRRAQLRCFSFGQDSCGAEGGRVRLAGGDFLIEKPPVKDDRALPRFEFRIQRLAKAAGPHLPGLLFVGHCFKRTSCYSFSLPLLSWGISLPLLSVRRPVLA